MTTDTRQAIAVHSPGYLPWLSGGLARSLVIGSLALGLMSLVTVLAFLALMGWSEGEPDASILNDAYFWRILRFSLWQALLSAGFSVALAIPVARAIAMDPKLPGKAWFLRWSLLCFVMPSLILITALVSIVGRSGWLTPWLGSGWNLYGLNGILLAHVFLNMPFAIRVLCFQWQSVPDTAWKVSAQLGLTGWQRFRLVEWPALRGVLPGLIGFIFLLCFNSFAVVLALGGGPRATTLEVAIFQALKFDFNPPEALTLAWTQLLVAGGLFVFFSRWGRLRWLAPPGRPGMWRPASHPVTRWLGRLAYLLATLYLVVPIAALVPRALASASAAMPWSTLMVVSGRSLLFATTAATLAVLLALGALSLWRRVSQRWVRQGIEVAALHHLVVPGMVLSVGIYIFFMPYINWLQWGWVAVIILNALIALPFVYHQLKPRVFDFDANYRRQVADLGLDGWTFWRWVYGPWLMPAIRRAWGLSFVIALGDFAVFGIFGNDDWRTLPWLIYALSGSYRLQESALASLILLAFAMLALWLLEGKHRRA